MASPTPGNWPGQQEAACPRPSGPRLPRIEPGGLVPPALGSARDPSSPHSCPSPPQQGKNPTPLFLDKLRGLLSFSPGSEMG